MSEVTIDGARVLTPADFYAVFFSAAAGVVPDYGGRNLDALADDVGDIEEPLVVVWLDAERSRQQLGDWFDKCLGALTHDGQHPLVTVELR